MTLRNPIVFETTFAIYTATEIVGEGGSGHIYKAEDETGNNWAVETPRLLKSYQGKGQEI